MNGVRQGSNFILLHVNNKVLQHTSAFLLNTSNQTYFAPKVRCNFSTGLLDFLADSLVHWRLSKLVSFGRKTIENSYSIMVTILVCNSLFIFFFFKNLKIILLFGVGGIHLRTGNFVLLLAVIKNMPSSLGNEISCSPFTLEINLKYWMQKVSQDPYYYFL